MTTATFQGWTRDYRINDADAYVDAILRIITSDKAEVNGEVVEGASLSHVVSELRQSFPGSRRGPRPVGSFQVPSNVTDQERMFQALGFKIVQGKVAKNTRGGRKFCSPAYIVTL